jgi:hypothetical protein
MNSLARPLLWRPIDALFKRRAELFADLAAGRDLRRWVRTMAGWTVGLMVLYGFLVGMPFTWRQMVYNAVKFPGVLVGTLGVTVFSLYVCNSFLGASLSFLQTTALVFSAVAATAVILAGFAPVIWFLMVTTTDYLFHVFINVVAFSFAGWCGWRFGIEAAAVLHRDQPDAAKFMRVMKAWLVVYGLVGTQVGWSLRPFFHVTDVFIRPLDVGGSVYVHLVQLVFNLLRSALGM